MPSDFDADWEARKNSIIGLGERSFRKSYYPQLQQNLDRLERFRTLLDCTSDFVILVGLDDGMVVDANVALGRLLDKPIETLIGRPFVSLGVGDSASVLEMLRKDMDISSGDEPPPAHALVTRFGSEDDAAWLELSCQNAQVDKQSYGIVVGRDITERKRNEEMMAELLAEKEAILDNVVVGIVMLRQRRIITCNRRFEEIFGYPPGAMIGQSTQILYATKEIFEATGQESYEAVGRGLSYSGTLMMARADGSQFWGVVTGRALDPLRPLEDSIWIYNDINEQKKAEEALRIAATAFEAQEGILITDAARVILRVNQAFTEITGYTAEEAVGQTPHLLNSGHHDATFFVEMTACIQQVGKWQGEIWNRRKNGEIYPEWLTITAVKDDAGKVTNFVATLTDITLRKVAEDEIRKLAFYDPLTGLPNRRLLLDRLKQAMASSPRSERYGALLFIDLDNFKDLNDNLGHHIGDLLLQQVAQRIAVCVREGDTVARLGGDEFVVMLEDLSASAQEAAAQTESVGEKILSALNETYELANYKHSSTPSIGVALFAENTGTVDDLLKRADLAMYQAKAAGRNTLRFFDPEMQTVVDRRAALENDLRAAVRQGEFVLYYQAQVIGEGRLTGAEVLLRWRHPRRGIVSPVEFIPLAEDTGLILPIGEWVLEAACNQLAIWAERQDMAELTLAVNVSAKQFRHKDFVNQVLAVIDCTGAKPQRLKLELTESLLVDDVEDIIAKMTALKSKGVGFSLDDFGTGYSSLSYLKRLPLDQLKIDQNFVRNILTDPNDAAIAKMVVALAESMGLSVIAEGVEIDAQRAFLARHGCHAYQGFLFSRPLPLEEFEIFAAKV
jgi:diguanylate cyclase (GGDEF)-like protein/PAS domain S-box-containing protein